jgi:hypothetical protein
MQSLRSNPWVIANADRVKLAEASSDPTGRPSAGGSTAVLVYQQGPRGPEMMGGRSGFASAGDVVLWVRSVVATSAEASIRDPNLTQANLFGKTLPSAQGEAPPVQAQQPQSPAASVPTYPQTYLQPQTATTFAMPMTAAPATMVQAPQQHLVIQQPPTQVLFAPQTAPMVYVPQATAAPAPNLYMATTPVAPTAMPMLAAAAPAQPMIAAQPMASLPQAAALPVGPALAGASLTTSSVSVPASSTTSRVRVRGPGPVASALARFGERLTTLGRTRIETVQETRLETQTAQTPPGQYMTLSSTSASPVLNQPQSTPPIQGPAPQCLPALPPQSPSPQSTQPSPQGSQTRYR